MNGPRPTAFIIAFISRGKIRAMRVLVIEDERRMASLIRRGPS